jgi:hypothetical protein
MNVFLYLSLDALEDIIRESSSPSTERLPINYISTLVEPDKRGALSADRHV